MAPNTASFLAARGLAHMLHKDYAQALADFDAGEKLDPKIGSIYRNPAMLLAACPDAKYRDGAKAAAQIKKAPELLPAGADLDEAQAAVAAELGHFDEAVQWQEKVLKNPAYATSTMKSRLELYRGSGKLQDKVALITGGDSGIGRAVRLRRRLQLHHRRGSHPLRRRSDGGIATASPIGPISPIGPMRPILQANGDLDVCVEVTGLPTLLGIKPCYHFHKRPDGSVYY